MLITLHRKGGLPSAGSLGAFVNSVCNNILFETYRSETKRRREVTEDDFDSAAPGTDAESSLMAAEAITSGSARPSSSSPQKEKDLLRWLFFEGRDKDDICRSWACDRNYLRVLLHRAKNRFRDRYSSSEETD